MPLLVSFTRPDNSRPTGGALRSWRRWVRVGSVGVAVAAVAVAGSLMLTSHQESFAAARVTAVAPPVGVGSGKEPAPTASAEMPADMPGMDMPATSHEHGDAAGPAVHRPLVPVLGAFGGATSAVLITAGMMRRKDRVRLEAKKSAHAANRSGR